MAKIRPGGRPKNGPKNGFCAEKTAFSAPSSAFICVTPMKSLFFFTQRDLTQLDYKLPISWGNSGYLWFSVGWSFGRLAGRFMAPIAQSGPLWAQKRFFFGSKSISCGQPKKIAQAKVALFGPKNAVFLAQHEFFCGQPQKNCYNHDGQPKKTTFCVYCIAGRSPGGHPGPFGAQNWPKNLIFLHLTFITHT